MMRVAVCDDQSETLREMQELTVVIARRRITLRKSLERARQKVFLLWRGAMILLCSKLNL